MNIRLIDIDSKIPNLALMQISAYHKQLGDTVGFDVENPDKVYVSCVFSKNAEQARGIQMLYPDAEFDIGGTGINLTHTIPEAAQKISPDYSLYPDINYSLGFTTRGCTRKCGFCVVPEKEGVIHKWQNIEDFYNPQFKYVKILDNNFTALKDNFFKQTDFIINKNLILDVTCGMDVRTMTEEIAERLSETRFYHQIVRFAWDNPADEEKVLAGIQMLKDAGIKPYNIVVFVLVGYDSTPEQDIYRCQKLKETGVKAFVMQYKRTPHTIRLARWANRRWLFESCDYKDYRG